MEVKEPSKHCVFAIMLCRHAGYESSISIDEIGLKGEGSFINLAHSSRLRSAKISGKERICKLKLRGTFGSTVNNKTVCDVGDMPLLASILWFFVGVLLTA